MTIMDEDRIQLIQTAIFKFFKIRQGEHGFIRLSHGAQFSNFGSIAGVFVLIAFVFLTVVSLIQESYLMSIISSSGGLFIVSYILDFQGFEIDTKNGNIRNYRSFLGYRTGDWVKIALLKKIKIHHDSILEKRSLDRGTTYASSREFDNHHYYTLVLVDEKDHCCIKLYEDNSITRIRILALNFSELSKLEFDNNISMKKVEVL